MGFKVEMNEFGMIRQKEVLFTSEEWLGDLLLDHLDDGLKVIHRGQEEGPYTAILYLRFEDGMLTTFSQKHFVKQPQRAGL